MGLMESYRFAPQPIKGKLLAEQMATAGLPPLDVSLEGSPPVAILVRAEPALTKAQQTKLGQVIASHDATVLTAAEQQALAAEVVKDAERKAARTALATLETLPNNTPVPSSVLKPILKWMDRLGMLDP
jgi:hypothetical protein